MRYREARLINRFARMARRYAAKLRLAIEAGDFRAVASTAVRYTLAENGPRHV
jgi:hypothetical protein